MIESSFFQIGPLPDTIMHGRYDLTLVTLSYAIAVLASYVALEIARILRQDKPEHRLFHLITGAFAMGAGIFTMHFVGMLAYIMPMPMKYAFFWTFLSLIVAIVASGFALNLIKDPKIGVYQPKFLLGGVVLGLAIASMHYTGMAGMIGVSIHYLPAPFFLSIVIAITASLLALWMMLECEKGDLYRQRILKIVSALVMGLGITGMHYMGMYAAVITQAMDHSDLSEAYLSPEILSFVVAFVASGIMLVTILTLGYRHLIFVKLLTSSLIVPLLIIPLAVILSQNYKTTNQLAESITENTIPKIQSLLELKSLAIQIQSLTSGFENIKTQDDRNNNKDRILALMAEMDKWERLFFEQGGSSSLSAKELKQLKDNVTFSAINTLELTEKKASHELIESQTLQLNEAEIALVKFINQAVATENENLSQWKSNLQGYAKSSLNFLLLALGSIILFSTAAKLFMSFQITRPLLRLRDVMKKILETGNLDTKANISTSDEVGQLGKSFNQLVENLAESKKKKDGFLAMAAHDLRNPLSVIIEASSLLLSEAASRLSEDQKKQLNEMIYSTGNSMLTLLNELLVVNALNAEMFKIDLQSVDLNKFGHDIFEFNQLLARKKKINFHLEMHLKDDYANFDLGKIDQVINNFLSNAFKFSKPYSHVTLRIIEDGEILRIEVEDEAGGIPENEQGKIFTQFSKLSIKPTGGELSHGLGLAISRDIIQAHKGRIGFNTKPGKGTIFYLEIDLKDKPSQPIIIDTKRPITHELIH